MAKFLVVSKDPDGMKETGVVEAADLDKAVSSIQSQGRFVVSIQPFDEEVFARAQNPGMTTPRK